MPRVFWLDKEHRYSVATGVDSKEILSTSISQPNETDWEVSCAFRTLSETTTESCEGTTRPPSPLPPVDVRTGVSNVPSSDIFNGTV
jgi:hypothetical protein